MEYTKRRNLNRGHLKLEVWRRGLDLFDASDPRHHEVENKLLRLIESLGDKRRTNKWQDSLPPHPPVQQSNNPTIQ